MRKSVAVLLMVGFTAVFFGSVYLGLVINGAAADKNDRYHDTFNNEHQVEPIHR
ncbi:hypothetical protein [Bacillus subtilis]|uniref:hypothetical protein n=1 Tax=Bacillus TaxID=1386 RepID=UPI002025CFC9|nr:hypothetical protein [Bacillus subtilis]MCL9628373.1 hypothetical protein [Bacillus subtilis]